jgi:hypothetical protein
MTPLTWFQTCLTHRRKVHREYQRAVRDAGRSPRHFKTVPQIIAAYAAWRRKEAS